MAIDFLDGLWTVYGMNMFMALVPLQTVPHLTSGLTAGWFLRLESHRCFFLSILVAISRTYGIDRNLSMPLQFERYCIWNDFPQNRISQLIISYHYVNGKNHVSILSFAVQGIPVSNPSPSSHLPQLRMSSIETPQARLCAGRPTQPLQFGVQCHGPKHLGGRWKLGLANIYMNFFLQLKRQNTKSLLC